MEARQGIRKGANVLCVLGFLIAGFVMIQLDSGVSAVEKDKYIPVSEADLIVTGDQEGYLAGAWISDGDVNGDGVTDILVSATGNYGGSNDVYLFFGGATRNKNVLCGDADVIFKGESGTPGVWLTCSGDINNDGYNDILICARDYYSSDYYYGKVYVMFGRSIWNSQYYLSQADVFFHSGSQHQIHTAYVDYVGDVNHDGYDDFCICSWWEDYIYMFFGKPSWSSIIDVNSADVVFSQETSGVALSACYPVGDLNGDGIDDICLADFMFNGGYGKTYIFFGKTGSWSSSINVKDSDASFIGENDMDRAGESCAGGDINNDGFNDLVIGDGGFGGHSSNLGRTYIIYGKSSNWIDDYSLSNVNTIIKGNKDQDCTGYQIDSGKDVDHDGYDDIIISSGNSNGSKGSVELFLGNKIEQGKSYLASECQYQFLGESPGHTWIGLRNSKLIGDFNGDKKDDLMMSSFIFDNKGKLYIFYNDFPYLNKKPEAKLSGPYCSRIGVNVQFDGSLSSDPDNDQLQYRWDFNNDGSWDTSYSTSSAVTHKWTSQYLGYVKLEVFDGIDTDTDTALIAVINETVVFLIDSNGDPISGGEVQYYSGSWLSFGTTDSLGMAHKSITPKSYSFRMWYGGAALDKVQDVSVNNGVIYQTKKVDFELRDSTNVLIDTGTISYYALSWRVISDTHGGKLSTEMLPLSFSFRICFGYASMDKVQDIRTDSTVVFRTVNVAIELRDSYGQLLGGGTASYYALAWREIGPASGGVIHKEMLPISYSFRMTYAGASNDKVQNVQTNPTVTFTTVNAVIQLKDSSGNLIDTGSASYYALSWRTIGNTVSGSISIQLLPNTYTFRMSFNYALKDKVQNIGTDPTVVFQTGSVTCNAGNCVKYYFSSWQTFTNGMELLPCQYYFRYSDNTQMQVTIQAGTVNYI